MKILLLTQWFDPEACFKGLAFARELRRQGHDVSVLTGFPNYPGGKVYPGYRIALWQREVMDNIPILRVPLYPSHNRSSLGRIANYVSFALTAAIGIFTLPRPDIVYVYSPPPTAALGAVLLRAVKRVPFILDVQDMWPDTLGATGMVRQGPMIAVIDWWLRHAYRTAAAITVLSPGFKRLLTARDVAPEKITIIPNWSSEASAGPAEATESDEFTIVYAGNLGPGQAIEVVLGAARRLTDSAPHARFLIAGDGVDAARLRAEAESQQLANITFLGRLPPDRMPALFATASALLVHLRDEPIFAVTIPSKTQAYLQAGKPILMGVRGDAAQLVTDAGAGLAFEPGNSEALAQAVLWLIGLPERQRKSMGAAGADFYRRHLSLEVGARSFVAVLEKALATSKA